MSLSMTRFVGTALLLATIVLWRPHIANADGYSDYVGCSAGIDAQPAELCNLNRRPSAFFESPDADVEYEICVYYPGDLNKHECLDHQVAVAGTLYENPLPRLIWPGNYYVTWSVAGVEVGSWEFDAEEIAVPPGSRVALLACSHSAQSSLITFAPRPRICTQFKHSTIDRAHEIWMSRLHWRHWGSRHAVGVGRWKKCGKQGCRWGPVKLVALNPQMACGYRSYTRLKIWIRGRRGTRHYSVAPVTC